MKTFLLFNRLRTMKRSLLVVVSLLFAPLVWAQNYNMELMGRLEYDVELSDVWGYVDEEDNEYALVGLHDNFSIVDVTNPSTPTEVFRTIGANPSTWRDIKTWGDYAYITCECGPGLLIVDMSPLPDTTSLQYTYWVDDSLTFYQAHNLYIDENGIAYIFGAFYSRGGAIMLDLNDDPMNPTPIGMFDVNYLHDGMVQGDTLWGGAVNLGQLQVIDVSDKANPEIISTWKTPNSFTHNAWFSDDSRYVFTTDEVRNGSIAAYDALNVLNPIELDVWTVSDTAIIPHNTHFFNDYLITSYYTYGINIIDVKRPKNMIETGHYDTSPDYVYEGFNGCWGAYPYLPSGNILATDIEEGLYVFKPTYTRGCYLEGSVTDEHTGASIVFPQIQILESGLDEKGSIAGDYAVSTLNEGSYTLVVSADGYFPDTVANIRLDNGQLTLQDVQLSNWPLGLEDLVGEKGFGIFPNPISGSFNVFVDQEFQELSCFDLNGKEVLHRDLHQGKNTFTHDLPNGSYLIRLSGNTNVETTQIIINNP